jgi:peroxiredoxin family protein
MANEQADRMTMIVFSGTVDRLFPVGILASGAVANGMDVDIFLTFWGLEAFTKRKLQSVPKIGKDYEEMGGMVMQAMQAKHVPSWYDTLVKAKEIGNVKVHACSMTFDLMGMKKEDFTDIVDDVIGVSEFINLAKDAKINLFI